MAKENADGDVDRSQPRMFEYNDAKSDKFWEITLTDTSHTVRYGRVGTDGQSKTKDFSDIAKALASYEKLVKEKVGKGYKEVHNEAESRSAKVTAARARGKEHEPFIDGILAEPDDPAPYLIYADFLEEQGDPKAELIRIQWELESEVVQPAARKDLAKREKALLKEHESEWLEDLAEDLIQQKEPEGLRWGDGVKLYQWTFARGFLDSLTIDYLLPNFGKALRRSPLTATLRRLIIRNPSNGEELMDEVEEFENEEWDYEDTPGLDNLTGARFQNLRHLEIAEDDQCHISLPNVHRFVKAMPRLEVLHLEAHAVETSELFKLKLPELRSMAVHHLTDYDLVRLAKNSSFGNLESISFHPHALEPDDDGAYINLEGLTAMCKSKHLTSLKHIEMRCSDFGDDGIRMLVNSPLFTQLETIEFMYGAITDAGAEALAGADLSNLKKLDVSGNYLSKQGVQQLKRAFPKVKAGEQFSGDPNNDEQEHLWYGDME